MKKSNVFLIVFISLLVAMVALPPVTLGCWFPASEVEPAFNGTDTISFLEYTLANDPVMREWRFALSTTGPVVNSEGVSFDPPILKNIQEWRGYYQNRPTLPDIHRVIYESKNLAQLQSLTRGLAQKLSSSKLASETSRNSFLNAILVNHDQAVLEYLIYAKRCEPFVTVDSQWDDVNAKRDKKQMNLLINEGLANYQSAASDFLKIRYAYQVIRLAHYVGDYERCGNFYDQLAVPVHTDSYLKYLSLLHKAGALKSLGKSTQALQITAQVFDQCPCLMVKAYRDFKIPGETTWNQCLGSLHNNHQKATLWMLRGLREKRIILEPLEQMYRLEPKSARLETMLVRQVNRLEELKILNSDYLLAASSSKLIGKEDRGLLRELKQYVVTAISQGKVRQPGLWNLVAGYLYFMDHDWDNAARYLKQAKQISTSNAQLRRQIILVDNLLSLTKAPSVTKDTETMLYSSVKWAMGLNRDNNNPKIKRSLLVLLGQKYLQQHQTGKAALCFFTADYRCSASALLDFYATPSDLQQLADSYRAKQNNLTQLLMNTSRTFGYLTEKIVFSADDFWYIQGTKLLRQGKFSEARRTYLRISRHFWEKTASGDGYLGVITVFNRDYWNTATKYPDSIKNKLTVRDALNANGAAIQIATDDAPKVNILVPQAGSASPNRQWRNYTKLAFVEKVLALESQAAKHPEQAAECYLQIANGFFHSPLWGYNDILWNGMLMKSIRDSKFEEYPFNFGPYPKMMHQKTIAFLREYGMRRIAIQYYYKAARATHNPEIAAQCYLLAHSARVGFSPLNREIARYGHLDSWGNENSPAILDTTEYRILKREYSHTQFMKKAIKECATLKDYLK